MKASIRLRKKTIFLDYCTARSCEGRGANGQSYRQSPLIVIHALVAAIAAVSARTMRGPSETGIDFANLRIASRSAGRSEESREGEEGVSTCRYRWEP